MGYEGKGKYINFGELPDPSLKYELGDLIGVGTYGEVFEAKNLETGKKVAVKIVENIEDNLDELEEEYRILTELNDHANFPTFYETCLKKVGKDEEHQIWFVMELCEGGSVTDLVLSLKKKDMKLREEHIAFILRETMSAVLYLHKNHVMHRDIKGHNILLTSRGEVKLVDFGICKHLKSTLDGQNTAIGTPYWMAPEVIACEQQNDITYDIRADVWSLGITAIEIGDGEPPLANLHPMRAMFQIVRNPPPTLSRPCDWDPDYVDFLAETLVKNPEYRPLMEELVEHPFITAVPVRDQHYRDELKQVLENKSVRVETKGEIFTKGGYLRMERKSECKKMYPDDLVSLENPTMDCIVEVLKKRYELGQIHSYVADVILIVNPYNENPIYDVKYSQKYKSKAKSDNEPHIFAVADRAYQDMMHHKEPQNIIITGNPGSGKTYSFHKVLSQLLYLGSGNPHITRKITQVSPIIEAFCNAASPDNPNSTQHVRYTEITYTKTGKLSGIMNWIYLLNTSRVTDRQQGCGNFHIFYYIYYGLSDMKDLSKYFLKENHDYRYLHPIENQDVQEYVDKFKDIHDNFNILDFSANELEFIIKMISTILNLGEMTYKEGSDGTARVSSNDTSKYLANLLEIDESKLKLALTTESDPKKEKTRALSVSESESFRDRVARLLYRRLIDWVVYKLDTNFTASRIVFGDIFSVSVLDSTGFETREFNSLDNMFTNIYNEQMFYFYLQSVFYREIVDYEYENIPFVKLELNDNRETLDKILKKPDGVLSLLEDGTMFGKKKLETIQSQLPSYGPVKRVGDKEFSIEHYKGRVVYNTESFVEKLTGYINVDFIELMRTSTNKNIEELFTAFQTRTGKVQISLVDNQTPWDKIKRKNSNARPMSIRSKGEYSQTRHQQSIIAQFRFSLIEFFYRISHGSPHYIFCLKANEQSSPSHFDSQLISQQLNVMKVKELLEIRQKGFSRRITFEEFLRRYKFLAFDFDETVDMTKGNCRLLLIRLKLEGWALGKSKIFLKYHNEEYLSRLYETEVKKIVRIQAMIRSYLARIRKKKGIPIILEEPDTSNKLTESEAALKVQKLYRGYMARKQYPGRNKDKTEPPTEEDACRIIQHFFRKWRTKTLFQQLQMFRAAKLKQLIYFSQQVHLYSQEFNSYLRRQTRSVPEGGIRDLDRNNYSEYIKSKVIPSVNKIPLSLSELGFFDTTSICRPFTLYKSEKEQLKQPRPRTPVMEDDEDWDSPIQKIMPKPEIYTGFTPEDQLFGLLGPTAWKSLY